MRERRAVHVLVGARIEVRVRGGIHLASHQRVELADSKIDPPRGDQAREEYIHEELGKIDSDAVDFPEAGRPLQPDARRHVEPGKVDAERVKEREAIEIGPFRES